MFERFPINARAFEELVADWQEGRVYISFQRSGRFFLKFQTLQVLVVVDVSLPVIAGRLAIWQRTSTDLIDLDFSAAPPEIDWAMQLNLIEVALAFGRDQENVETAIRACLESLRDEVRSYEDPEGYFQSVIDPHRTWAAEKRPIEPPAARELLIDDFYQDEVVSGPQTEIVRWQEYGIVRSGPLAEYQRFRESLESRGFRAPKPQPVTEYVSPTGRSGYSTEPPDLGVQAPVTDTNGRYQAAAEALSSIPDGEFGTDEVFWQFRYQQWRGTRHQYEIFSRVYREVWGKTPHGCRTNNNDRFAAVWPGIQCMWLDQEYYRTTRGGFSDLDRPDRAIQGSHYTGSSARSDDFVVDRDGQRRQLTDAEKRYPKGYGKGRRGRW